MAARPDAGHFRVVPDKGDGGPGREAAAAGGDLRSVLVTSVLNLEPLDLDLFRGRHYWVPVSQRLFSWQVMGEVLVVAAKAAGEELQVHSLHCYFIRAGDPSVLVLYQVEHTRTGQSFSVHAVKAMQHGKPIFICQASFQEFKPALYSTSSTCLMCPLQTQEEFIQQYLQEPNLMEKYRRGLNKMLAQEVPIEMKPVNPPDFFHQNPQEPKQLFWVRARGHIGDCDMKLHCCMATYISDYVFLGTALLPHYHRHQVQFMVSLDHSMWFHAPFRAYHWMLYECESPWAGGSQGLVHGQLSRRDGVLVVSCAQEGVIRVQQPPPTSKL